LTDVEPVLLDTDTLSELSRGNRSVCERAIAYLSRFGRFTITAVTVFERLRGYRLAIRNGRPYQRQMQAFAALVASSDVLPFDESAAGVAGEIWSRVSANRRSQLGDILIAGIAVSRQLPLVTRNRRDFEELGRSSGAELRLLDWSAPRGRK
jgi:tRNA(fMet)-specific endonuclease VapC